MEKGGRAVVVWKWLEQMPRSAKMLSLELRPSGRLLLLAVSSPWRWSPTVGRGKPEIIFFKKSREGWPRDQGRGTHFRIPWFPWNAKLYESKQVEFGGLPPPTERWIRLRDMIQLAELGLCLWGCSVSGQPILAVSFLTWKWSVAVNTRHAFLAMLASDLSLPSGTTQTIRWGRRALCLTFKAPHILALSFVVNLIFHSTILPIPGQSPCYTLNITTEPFCTSRSLLLLCPLLWMPRTRHSWPSSGGSVQILVLMPRSLIHGPHRNFFLFLPLEHSTVGKSALPGAAAIDQLTLCRFLTLSVPQLPQWKMEIIIVPTFARALLKMTWVNKVHGTVLDK